MEDDVSAVTSTDSLGTPRISSIPSEFIRYLSLAALYSIPSSCYGRKKKVELCIDVIFLTL